VFISLVTAMKCHICTSFASIITFFFCVVYDDMMIDLLIFFLNDMQSLVRIYIQLSVDVYYLCLCSEQLYSNLMRNAYVGIRYDSSNEPIRIANRTITDSCRTCVH